MEGEILLTAPTNLSSPAQTCGGPQVLDAGLAGNAAATARTGRTASKECLSAAPAAGGEKDGAGGGNLKRLKAFQATPWEGGPWA